MASKRQIFVEACRSAAARPVAVQTMTKTETANLGGDDGADPQGRRRRAPTWSASRCRASEDAEALKTIVAESPIPVIADIHFNHTLALKAIDAGAHCIRLNPGNIGGREKVAEVAEQGERGRRADADRGQLRLAAQAPARARARERRSRRWSPPRSSSSS